MRSRFLFLLAPLPLAFVATTFAACGSEQKLDDLCAFLGDEKSCYRTFLTDIGEQCTMGTFEGTFDTREMLAKCTVNDSNVPANIVTQVDFDPPIDLTQLPVKSGSAKLTINGAQCGTIEFGEDDKLAITIDAAPALADPAAECVTSDTQFCGSSFSNTPVTTDALMSTTCASGVAFSFHRAQIEQKCPDLAGFVPHAKLEVVPNGVGKPGSVKLSIAYTPDNTLTYVNCKILEALPACANGVRDGVETDIDCGGGQCTTKCAGDQSCINGTDCASNICAVVNGVKKCTAVPDAGAPDGG